MFIFTNFTDDWLNVMMRPDEKYKSMVSAFRMSELQSLMSFAGKSKAGKKSELQVTRNNNIEYLISVKHAWLTDRFTIYSSYSTNVEYESISDLFMYSVHW